MQHTTEKAKTLKSKEQNEMLKKVAFLEHFSNEYLFFKTTNGVQSAT